MKIKLNEIWEQAQDLTFGEACQLQAAAETAAEDKLMEIRRRKNKNADAAQELLIIAAA